MECGTHWDIFDKKEGERIFREKMNYILNLYSEPYELLLTGDILRRPEGGFSHIFKADTPTDDDNIKSRIESAVFKYRHHGSSLDDRRQAVRDLADVLEYLRPKIKLTIDKKDESDLFNIINNFGVRHYNALQKTDYDPLWLSWMFYLFLSTIHMSLRKISKGDVPKT